MSSIIGLENTYNNSNQIIETIEDETRIGEKGDGTGENFNLN